jgi:hypothetical protein
MLIYDPTVDPYHCAIRILAIIEHGATSELHVDSVRIADYYLAYPSKVADIRLPNHQRGIRKQSKLLATPYRNPFEAKSTFERMRPIFQAALSCLVAAGYLDAEKLKRGLVARGASLPDDLSVAVSGFLVRQSLIREFVIKELTTIPLLGANGLKDRSGLLEYRYDPA